MSLRLTQQESCGVTLLVGKDCPRGVSFAFTERTGGVSEAPFATLNMGDATGDSGAAVAENRRRAMCAFGIPERYQANLIAPKQVHGTEVCVVRDSSPASIRELHSQVRAGCDAVVCCTSDVPVMLCFADCLPVVLVASHAFAVVHSGWRGTFGCIAARALDTLCREAQVAPDEVMCAIGPHIAAQNYEVSDELMRQFVDKFGEEVRAASGGLDLAKAVSITLEAAGVQPSHITVSDISTPEHTDRFFSYRAEQGQCGRFAALAWMDPAIFNSASLSGGSGGDTCVFEHLA